jgi:hypothetical protein
MVVKSNSSASGIKVVASKKNGAQYITVINTGTNASIKLSITGNVGSAIKDIETGAVYTITNGVADAGNISQYQIRYFVSYDAPDNGVNYSNDGRVNSIGGNQGSSANSSPKANNSGKIVTQNTHDAEGVSDVAVTDNSLDSSTSQQEENKEMKGGLLTGKAISETERLVKGGEKMPVFWKIMLVLFVFGILFLTVDILYNVWLPI